MPIAPLLVGTSAPFVSAWIAFRRSHWPLDIADHRFWLALLLQSGGWVAMRAAVNTIIGSVRFEASILPLFGNREAFERNAAARWPQTPSWSVVGRWESDRRWRSQRLNVSTSPMPSFWSRWLSCWPTDRSVECSRPRWMTVKCAVCTDSEVTEDAEREQARSQRGETWVKIPSIGRETALWPRPLGIPSIWNRTPYQLKSWCFAIE